MIGVPKVFIDTLIKLCLAQKNSAVVILKITTVFLLQGEEMNEFKSYHPIVNFIYFVFAICFSCLLFHPVTLAISLVCSFTYLAVLKGIKQIKKNLIYIIPMLLLMALINPIFNHQGATILTYLPSGNPLTLESIYYGIISATMIISVILLFSCFNEVMTSDKFIYLFGRLLPSLSLIFSMILRFIPKFTHQLKITADSQKCIGKDISSGSIIKRAKNGLSILSIMTTWSLENAIDTSDSMKSRGYGLPGRSAYSIYSFSKRDTKVLASLLLLAFYVIMGSIIGETRFSCFPVIRIAGFSIYGLSVFLAYFILLFMPIIIEILEVIKWKSIRSKI